MSAETISNASSSSTGKSATNQDPSAAQTSESPNALVRHAKDAAVHLADQAKEKVGEQISEQTKKSVSDIADVAKALRHTSEELGDNIASPLVGLAADQVQRASDFLQTATVDDVVRSVESFAKREPLLFLGGAFALGMLGARFLKSSSHHGTRQNASQASRADASRNAGNYGQTKPAGLSSLASGSVGSGSGRS
jgi:hypothetical protein